MFAVREAKRAARAAAKAVKGASAEGLAAQLNNLGLQLTTVNADADLPLGPHAHAVLDVGTALLLASDLIGALRLPPSHHLSVVLIAASCSADPPNEDGE